MTPFSLCSGFPTSLRECHSTEPIGRLSCTVDKSCKARNFLSLISTAMDEPLMADNAILLIPEHRMVYVVGSVITCFLGAVMSLVLAATAMRIKLHRVMVFTALGFGLQCVFSLHFISMMGMRLSVDWGFDLLWTLGSIAMIAIFGTCSITLVLNLRHHLEHQIEMDFPGYPNDPSTETLGFYVRYCTLPSGPA